MQTFSLTYGQTIICFYMMFLYDVTFTMREVASRANTYADCHYIYHDTFST